MEDINPIASDKNIFDFYESSDEDDPKCCQACGLPVIAHQGSTSRCKEPLEKPEVIRKMIDELKENEAVKKMKKASRKKRKDANETGNAAIEALVKQNQSLMKNNMVMFEKMKDMFESAKASQKNDTSADSLNKKEAKCPVWNSDDSLESYKAEIMLWNKSSKMNPEAKLSEFLQSIKEHRKPEYERLSMETIKKPKFFDNPVEKDIIEQCLVKLETWFGKTTFEQMYEHWNEFINLKKSPTEKMTEFMNRFDRLNQNLKNEGLNLQETIKAIHLLSKCDASPEEIRAIVTKVDTTKDTTIFEDLKKALREITAEMFTSKSKKPDQDAVFQSEYDRGRPRYRKDGDSRGRYDRTRSGSRHRGQGGAHHSTSAERRSATNPGNQPRTPYKDNKDRNSSHNRNWSQGRKDRFRSNSRKRFEKNGDNKKNEFNSHYTLPNPPAKDESGNYDIFTTKTVNHMLVDSACPKSLTGQPWLDIYLESLSKSERKEVITKEFSGNFKFGPGSTYASVKAVTIPVKIGSSVHQVTGAIVNANVPFLLGMDQLKKLDAKIDFSTDRLQIGESGEIVEMTMLRSGHYAIEVDGRMMDENTDIADVFFCQSLETMRCFHTAQGEKDEGKVKEKMEGNRVSEIEKKVMKVHKMMRHASPGLMYSLFKNSGENKVERGDKKIFDDIPKKCDICLQHKKTPSRPKTGLPRAMEFNEVVSLDLKEFREDNVHVMYCVCEFSKLTRGKIVKDKKPETIVKAVVDLWILGGGIGPGYPNKGFYSDNGGEFQNENFSELCEKSGLTINFIPAGSAWSNGVNERNHSINDIIVHKIRSEDPDISLQEALDNALFIKNCEPNSTGFSSHQIVYGNNPNFPGLTNITPPMMEACSVSNAARRHLERIDRFRKLYREADCDRRIKIALKNRLNPALEQFFTKGQTVYFKEEGTNKWKTGKVILQDGAIVWLKYMNYLRRVHNSRIIPSGKEHSTAMASTENEEKSTSTEHTTVLIDNEKDENMISAEHTTVLPDKTLKTAEPDQKSIQTEMRPKKGKKIEFTLFADPANTRNGVVIAVAKKSSKAKNSCWIRNNEDEIECHDFAREVESWKEISKSVAFETKTDNEGKTSTAYKVSEATDDILGANKLHSSYVTIIPASEHNTPEIIEAKNRELEKWAEYDAVKIVKRDGHSSIKTRWVVTLKDHDDGKNSMIKARLCVRGDQQGGSESIRKDSPTASRDALKVACFIAANEGFAIRAIDFSSAFLQGLKPERKILVEPPLEVKNHLEHDEVWQLEKPAYGLPEASRRWWLALRKQLRNLGAKNVQEDEALMFVHDDKGNLNGVIILHVDDAFLAGTETFHLNVTDHLKEAFTVSKEQRTEFVFTGIHVVQHKDMSIEIDQDDFVKNIQDIDTKSMLGEAPLNKYENRCYRKAVGQLSWAAQQTMHEICFDVLELSTKNNTSSRSDLRNANKVIQKAKKITSHMTFKRIGRFQDLSIGVFTDSSFRNIPILKQDTSTEKNIKSAKGNIVLIKNQKEDCCLINWQSKAHVRVVKSVKTGETRALVDGIEVAREIASIIHQVYTGKPASGALPVDAWIDSESLLESVKSDKQIDEKVVRHLIFILKQSIEYREVRSIDWCSSKEQLADIFTKKGVNPELIRKTVLNNKLYFSDEGKTKDRSCHYGNIV